MENFSDRMQLEMETIAEKLAEKSKFDFGDTARWGKLDNDHVLLELHIPSPSKREFEEYGVIIDYPPDFPKSRAIIMLLEPLIDKKTPFLIQENENYQILDAYSLCNQLSKTDEGYTLDLLQKWIENYENTASKI